MGCDEEHVLHWFSVESTPLIAASGWRTRTEKDDINKGIQVFVYEHREASNDESCLPVLFSFCLAPLTLHPQNSPAESGKIQFNICLKESLNILRITSFHCFTLS